MYDMTIRLRTDSGKCLYEQIYEHIRKEISDGKLLTGEKLPSTRFLAEYLQVSRSTVDYAYGQLLDEGYIEARPCKGYFVCPVKELFRMEAENTETGQGAWAERKRSHEKTRTESGESRGKDQTGMEAVRQEPLVEEGGRSAVFSAPCQYDFSPYGIDMSGFPFDTWRKITKNILTYANGDLFSRGGPQGDLQLRQTISRYLHSSRGVNCSPEQIIVGAGNDYLLLLLEKILGRHVRIAMENPTYARSYLIFRSFAYDIVTVDMDENGMRPGQLEQERVRCAYVMPSHQFPAGTVMPIGRRLELLKWACGGPDRYLIEDDYDSEFRYRGKPIPALQASDEQGRVIYIGSFSKAIAPAIRVSFMVLPEPLLEKYKRDCFFYSCTVSRIDQSILNVFIRDGYFERHLNKMRKIYRAKHELLLEELRPFRKKFRISGENAGLHLLLTARDQIKEHELVRKAAEKGVRVYGLFDSMAEPGDEAGSDARGKMEGAAGVFEGATVLLGFGGLDSREIREGIERLKEAWL
ncbi:MAG: PLP-dependent aminotransferase family protein [Acetatifactor sp.]|nr:PLP-dependent aminotransferase family protein [Acetatifactor sp.]